MQFFFYYSTCAPSYLFCRLYQLKLYLATIHRFHLADLVKQIRFAFPHNKKVRGRFFFETFLQISSHLFHEDHFMVTKWLPKLQT